MKVARKVLELTLCLIRTEKYHQECRESSQRGGSRGAISKHHCYTNNPQWRRFLSQMKNKTSLIRFLADEFKKEKYKEILQHQRKVLFITSEEKCWKLTGKSVEEVPELASSQEQADTRLLLHASHAARGSSSCHCRHRRHICFRFATFIL